MPDLNRYEILFTYLGNIYDLCGNKSHFCVIFDPVSGQEDSPNCMGLSHTLFDRLFLPLSMAKCRWTVMACAPLRRIPLRPLRNWSSGLKIWAAVPPAQKAINALGNIDILVINVAFQRTYENWR
jgi:hypothetical protein